MDSVTQVLLGATIAEAGFRHKLGGRALAFGGFCGMAPDLDVFLGAGDEWARLVYHRGASHSLLVLPFVALLFGFLGRRWGKGEGSYWDWAHLAFWGLVTHPLLDVCTAYGTQLFAPFDRARFAIDAVSIIDPIYSVPLLIAMILAARKRTDRALSRRFAAVALLFTTSYLGFGYLATETVRAEAGEQLAERGVAVKRLRAFPPILFPFARRVAAKTPSGDIWVGATTLVSTLPMKFEVLESYEGPEVEAALSSRAGKIFEWFADGYIHTSTSSVDGQRALVLSDQRYGLLSSPTWTPFAARATFDDEGGLIEVRRLSQRRDVSVTTEVQAALELLSE